MKSFLQGTAVLLASVLVQCCSVLVPPESLPRPETRLETSDPVLNQGRIFVVGDITEESAAEVIRQLLYLDAQGQETIRLYLMTPGGDLKAVFAVLNTLQMIQSRVDTYALGECNSGGAVLLAGGTGKRRAFPDSTIVIHGMEIRRKTPARYVELTQEAYTAFWRQHAGLPESWLPIPPGKFFILSAREALEYGLIDEIIALRSPAPPR
jgi:ATP-dependent Clp protease protease subunit